MKESAKEELKRLKKYYGEELKRKDKMIEDIREQNMLLLKASLKGSEKIDKLTEKLKKALGLKK